MALIIYWRNSWVSGFKGAKFPFETSRFKNLKRSIYLAI